MSGYGGQPPPWNDPYGQGQGWKDPQGGWGQADQGYGPGYGHDYGQGYGPGYGPPGVPGPGSSTPQGSTIAALVCNCVAVAMCCNLLTIPGIITSIVALNRSHNPRSARSLTMWSWIIFGAALAIQILAIAVLIIIDVNTPDPYDSGGI